MIRFLLLAFLLGLLIVDFAEADETTKRERILYLFEVNGVHRSVDNQIDAMLEQSKHQYADFPEELWTDGRLYQLFQDYREDLIEAYVDAADRGLSDEELTWIIDFLETEQGQKMLRLNNRTRPLYDEAANSVYPPFMEAVTKLLLQYAEN